MCSDGYLPTFSYMISYAPTLALPTPFSFSRLWICAPQRHRISTIHANRVPSVIPTRRPRGSFLSTCCFSARFCLAFFPVCFLIRSQDPHMQFTRQLSMQFFLHLYSDSVTSDRFRPCSPTTKASFLQQPELCSSFTGCMRRSEVG